MVQEATTKARSLHLLASLRIVMAAIMLWAFFDKLFGLGFATCRDDTTNEVVVMCNKAWLNGGSPTSGFLEGASSGPLSSIFQSMSGIALVDVLFMSGLLLIGLALLVGVGMKIAAVSGSLLMFMMWAAVLPKQNHLFLDEHVVYILVLLLLLVTNENQKWGLGDWWKRQSIVKRYPVLE